LDTVRYYISRVVLLLLFSSFLLPVFAQKKLVFTYSATLETIEMKVGHRAAILYTGYRGQTEFARENVTEITDSTIVLGVDITRIFPNSKPGKNNRLTYKVISIKDIKGFRRMTIGRQLAKSSFNIAGVVGSFYLLHGIYSSDISNFSSFAISVGVGVGLYGINNLIFPENIKYYMQEGWTVKVVDP
jgi:hypothetical protein